MSSTIFTAPQYDPRRERRKRAIIAGIVAAAIIVGILAYLYRNWPEERVVDRFFTALVNKDFETAYGIWLHDPNWKQHPQNYPNYSFREFYNDWGPGGEWGIIKSFHVNITSILTTGHTEEGFRAIFFRIATLNVGPIRKAIEEAGFRILDPSEFRL